MGKQKDVEASVVADVGAFNAANTSHDLIPLDDVPHQARAGLEFKFGMAADALNAIGVKVQHSLVPKSADLTLQKETEDSNDHISNSSQGLVSFVQDSRSPPQEECQGAESTNIEAKIGEAQEEVEKVELLAQQQETIQNVRLSNGPVVIEPNGNFRFSQLAGIELEVDLNPRNIRKSIRSQAYKECRYNLINLVGQFQHTASLSLTSSFKSRHPADKKEENMGKRLYALLGRNPKAPKLKTLASLAIARIPILKHLHTVRCSHARSDVVQLLNLSYPDRALLRVELVIREQNMLDVLDIVEKYCHLLIEGFLLVENNRLVP
ncbi:hypothetical protein RHGRI_034973 [Rhododendron griersonianum]|uniref:Uncharacterized protein n=1 Tax=Rhododendron griersonianum TaxID=479676 RepID=A0AAV6I8T5_9ERIC|nr:hypothetical protein RHGRI_034973 [Rhododendron griersonianum]